MFLANFSGVSGGVYNAEVGVPYTIYIYIYIYIEKLEKYFTYLKVRKQFLLISLVKVKVVWKQGKSLGGENTEVMES